MDRPALTCIGNDGVAPAVSYGEQQEQSARFADLLTAQGVGPGDRVACLLPRIPELLVVMLGALRAGAVYQPLFKAFGPKAIEQRIAGSAAKLIVTDSVNRPKLDDIADPRWPYGQYYAAIEPLLLGSTTTFQEAEFSVDATCQIISDHAITNFAAAPTVYRLIIAADKD